MADRQDDQEVELKAVEDESEEDIVPLSKRHRLVKAVDKKKDGSSSSTLPLITPIRKFFAVVIAAEERGVVEELKHKAPVGDLEPILRMNI